MRVGLFHSEKQRCNDFAAAVYAGVRAYDECIHRDIHQAGGEGIDIGILMSVRRRELFDALSAYIYLDKGYTRDWAWRRCAVNACEPTDYVGCLGMPSDRREALAWRPKAWRRRGDKVVMLWSNEDEHVWRGLPPPEEYADDVVRDLRRHTDRRIVYRCKPNRRPVRDVVGAVMADLRRPLIEELADAHAVVLVGGGSSICALLEGVPAVVLGDAPTRSISSTSLEEIECPRLASDGEREAILNDLAYSQWSADEFVSGKAWRWLRERLLVK